MRGKFVVKIIMTTVVALLLVNIMSKKFMIANIYRIIEYVYEREALCFITFESSIAHHMVEQGPTLTSVFHLRRRSR